MTHAFILIGCTWHVANSEHSYCDSFGDRCLSVSNQAGCSAEMNPYTFASSGCINTTLYPNGIDWLNMI